MHHTTQNFNRGDNIHSLWPMYFDNQVKTQPFRLQIKKKKKEKEKKAVTFKFQNTPKKQKLSTMYLYLLVVF